MKLIVGLGNPGDIYKGSRHNIGFSVVKAIAKSYKISLKKEKSTFSLSAKVKIGQQNVILAIPLTFMNLSGIAVSALLKKYRVDLPRPLYKGEDTLGKKGRGLDNLLVICDDLDLELGRLKLRSSGSSAGHRGLNSIIDSLGTTGFARLRIGIGRPVKDLDTTKYVLSPFTRIEKEEVRQIINQAVKCCEGWVIKGITETMNIFNPSASTSLSTSTRSILSERSESKECK